MGRSFAIGLFLRLLRVDPLLSILRSVVRFLESVCFGFGKAKPLKGKVLGRRNDGAGKALNTFGAMDEGAKDGLVTGAWA